MSSKELLKMAEHSQIETKFSGTTTDVDTFWPPSFPSEDYGLDLEKIAANQNKNLILKMEMNKLSNNQFFQK